MEQGTKESPFSKHYCSSSSGKTKGKKSPLTITSAELNLSVRSSVRRLAEGVIGLHQDRRLNRDKAHYLPTLTQLTSDISRHSAPN